VEIRVSKEGVTSIFGFGMEEHDNAFRLYGEFSWKGSIRPNIREK
jgi:hypothetical protein